MINNWLPILPIIITMMTAISCFFTWHSPSKQRRACIIGAAILLCTVLKTLPTVIHHGIIVTHLGDWPAVFGITLVLDPLSVIMLLLTAVAGLAVAIFSSVDLNPQQTSSGFYPAYAILLIGLCGAFVTADIFNLYVWFEVTVIASFVLMASGNGRYQLDGTLKYAIMNLIATLFLLMAIALLYGITGTLNLADLAVRIPLVTSDSLSTAVLVLLVLSFSMKAALFPLFFWMPASYHTPSFSSSAIFAAMLSKLGVYALIRISSLLFVVHSAYLHNILLVLALLTLVIGIMGALAQYNVRRLLSFTLISHIGFIIVGVALLTPLALAAAIFYLFQHVMIKTQLFLMSGLLRRLTGTEDLRKMGGLYKRHPWISSLFIVSALALAGIPPLSGFWGKFALINAAIKSHAYISTIIMTLVSLMTLWVMIKTWVCAFLPNNTHPIKLKKILSKKEKQVMLLPIIGLTFIILSISFFPKSLFNLSLITSHYLLNPQLYIHAVLGGG